MNRTLASIRISTALLLAVLLTAALFTLLRSMTVLTYIPEVIEPTKINFSRVRIETGIKTKRDIAKPDKPPVIDIGLPPLATRGPTTPVTVRITPEVATELPPPGNLAFGSDRDVAPILRITPVYPDRAARAGTEGWVHVRFNISAAGSVTDAVVVANSPSTVFDKAALDAIARWRYNPKVMDGEPVERRGVETILRFELSEE